MILRVSLRPWRKTPYSQMAASVSVSLILFLVALLMSLGSGVSEILRQLEQNQVVTVYLKPRISVNENQVTQDQIRETLGAPLGELKVTPYGRGEFLSELKRSYPSLVQELEGLGQEVEGVVPEFISISGELTPKRIQAIHSRVGALPGVAEVQDSRNRFEHIRGAFATLGWVVQLIAMGLMVALGTALFQLSRINGNLFEDFGSLVRLMGGGAWTSRLPTLMSGLTVGALGGALASVAWLFMAHFTFGEIRAASPLLAELPPPGLFTPLWIFLVGSVTGALSGFLGKAA